MSGLKPPQGRPPVPPLDKPPPKNLSPQSPASYCTEQSGMTTEGFWFGVKETIKRELIRHCVEQKKPQCMGGIDAAYTIPPIGEAHVDALIAAFKEGKTVPGLSLRTDSAGKCIMNWYALACFARWYTSLDVTTEMRDYILGQLREGVTAQELIDDEAVGLNWYFCKGDEGEDVAGNCCPAEILDDWYYKELTQGIVPQTEPEKTPWVGVLLLGAGVFAVAMTIRAVAQHAGTNPSSSPQMTHPSLGKTRPERNAIRGRVLRTDTAGKHSFEVWDELREHLGTRRTAPEHVRDAAGDLEELVNNLNSLGTKTNAKTEIEWMLNLSAGAS